MRMGGTKISFGKTFSDVRRIKWSNLRRKELSWDSALFFIKSTGTVFECNSGSWLCTLLVMVWFGTLEETNENNFDSGYRIFSFIHKPGEHLRLHPSWRYAVLKKYVRDPNKNKILYYYSNNNKKILIFRQIFPQKSGEGLLFCIFFSHQITLNIWFQYRIFFGNMTFPKMYLC